jgi:transcriptional regulator with XRE-family HTH domain
MREVASAIGVPLTTYREWEYGRAVRSQNLVKLANFFGVSMEQLTGESNPVSLTTEQRLKRALDDLAIVHSEIKSQAK